MTKTIRRTSRNVLYLFPEPIRLTYTDLGIRVNLPMNRFQPKVFKGNINTIDFIVQDNDRKPVNLIDKTLNCIVSNVTYNERVLSRELEVLDEWEGHVRLNLYPGDINGWVEGFYSYAVEFSSESGQRGFMYTDQAQNAIGYFELRSGPNGNPTPAYVANKDDFTPSGITYLGQDTTFITSAWPGSPLANMNDDLHTIAIWTTDYLGVIRVEATLDQNPPTEDSDAWTTILEFDHTSAPKSGVQYSNFYGNYTFVRVTHNPTNLNEGTLDKVHYRP